MKISFNPAFWLLLLLASGLTQCTESGKTAIPPATSVKSLTNPTLDGITNTSSVYDAPGFTYTLTVPFNTNVAALRLGFTLSAGTTVKPASGSIQNFTAPVVYTVTAADASTQTYTIKVIVRPPAIESTFAKHDEGWTISGDAQGNSLKATYFPVGGVSDGYIYAKDDVIGSTWFFKAPPACTGNKSNYYGGMLIFALFQDSALISQFDEADLIIENGGKKIVYKVKNYPRKTWTEYSVAISAAAGWLQDPHTTKVAASEASMKAVLLNVTAMYIRGEFENGPDAGGLDNVKLSPPK